MIESKRPEAIESFRGFKRFRNAVVDGSIDSSRSNRHPSIGGSIETDPKRLRVAGARLLGSKSILLGIIVSVQNG